MFDLPEKWLSLRHKNRHYWDLWLYWKEDRYVFLDRVVVLPSLQFCFPQFQLPRLYWMQTYWMENPKSMIYQFSMMCYEFEHHEEIPCPLTRALSLSFLQHPYAEDATHSTPSWLEANAPPLECCQRVDEIISHHQKDEECRAVGYVERDPINITICRDHCWSLDSSIAKLLLFLT